MKGLVLHGGEDMVVEVRSSGIETDSFHKPVRVSNRVLGKFWGLRKVMGQGEEREIEPPHPRAIPDIHRTRMEMILEHHCPLT